MSNISSAAETAVSSDQIFSEQEAYKFLKVEQYFPRYKEWATLGAVDSHTFHEESKSLTLNFIGSDGNSCSMCIYESVDYPACASRASLTV